MEKGKVEKAYLYGVYVKQVVRDGELREWQEVVRFEIEKETAKEIVLKTPMNGRKRFQKEKHCDDIHRTPKAACENAKAHYLRFNKHYKNSIADGEKKIAELDSMILF